MEVSMKEGRKKGERRKVHKRRLLTEKEFRKLIESGKTSKGDRRSWVKRRKTKRRKKKTGL
jgi:hypothetical protein